MDVEGLRQRSLDDRHVGAVPLISTDDGIGPPIGPVDVIFKESNGERVGKGLVTSKDLARIGAVVFGRVDRIGTGIDPVDPLGVVVNGQAVPLGQAPFPAVVSGSVPASTPRP